MKRKAQKLVKTSCEKIEKSNNPQSILESINKGEHPFRDKNTPELYVFAYDKDVNIVAHPKSSLVGKNYKGKPDVKGKNFRDEIVSTALKSKKGSVRYSYTKPGQKDILSKIAYVRLCKDYILASGVYVEN